jgi:hypothetical protein
MVLTTDYGLKNKQIQKGYQMSRKTTLWKEKIGQAGGGTDAVMKLLPQNVKGEGRWMTKTSGTAILDGQEITFGAKPGQGAGNQVSLPMSERKQAILRKLVK